MGVSRDANGWTAFTPKPDTNFVSWAHQQGSSYPSGGDVGDGTRFVYVSSSGNNANDGSFATPLADGKTARSLMRDGKPDWMLLKKGDTFSVPISVMGKSGLDANNPMLISSYDAAASQNPPEPNPYTGGDRPLLQIAPQLDPSLSFNGTSNNIAVVGIKFYAYTRDPGNAAFNLTDAQTAYNGIVGVCSSMDGLLIEDCYVGFFIESLDLEMSPVYNQIQNLTVRRNQFVSCYPFFQDEHVGGIFIERVAGGPGGFVIEENVIDNNGWMGGATFTGTGSGTNLTTSAVTGTIILGEPVQGTGVPASTFIMSQASGAPGGAGVYVTNNATTSSGAALTSGAGSKGITWAAPSGFCHNVYFAGSQINGDAGSNSTPVTYRGNMTSNEGSVANFRAGGEITNNLFLRSPTPIALQQPIAFTSVIADNVFMDGIPQNPAPSINAINFAARYIDENITVGSSVVTNNIVCHGVADTSSSAHGFFVTNGVNAASLTNNIVYNWSMTTPANVLVSTAGSVYGTHVQAGGSGYTDLTQSILSSASSNTPFTSGSLTWNGDGQDYVILKVADATNIHAYGVVYTTAGGLSGLYNATVLDALLATPPQYAILYGSNFTALGGSTFTGTLYYPYYQTNLVYPVSGPGSSAQLDLISVGGSITALGRYGSDTLLLEFDCDAGQNYIAGDVLTDGAGKGLQIKVDSICVNTTTPNKMDAAGTNELLFPDPNRTAGSYYAMLAGSTANATFTGVIAAGVLTISGIAGVVNVGDAITWSGQTSADYIKSFGTGTGGNGTYNLAGTQTVGSRAMSSYTTTQLITAMRGQSKATWNVALTADAVNDYIQEGFGIFETTPAPSVPHQQQGNRGHPHFHTSWHIAR